jgi:hypothetical protein
LCFTSPAFALVCRHYDGDKICILNIKRSANNHWQRYVAMSFVRVKAPVEIYNSRAKFKLNKDGTVLQFRENSPGEMICSFFLKKS